jgi:hypothetical protein
VTPGCSISSLPHERLFQLNLDGEIVPHRLKVEWIERIELGLLLDNQPSFGDNIHRLVVQPSGAASQS